MEKGQNLLKNCLERIEEMYTDNKNLQTLYQQTLQKYNKLVETIKEKDEIIKSINSFLDKYNFNSLEELIVFVDKIKSNENVNINVNNKNSLNSENKDEYVNIENNKEVVNVICDFCRKDIIEYNDYINKIKEKTNKYICINCFNQKAENNPNFNKNYKQCEYNIGNIYSCTKNAKNVYDNKNYCNIHYNDFMNYKKNIEDDEKGDSSDSESADLNISDEEEKVHKINESNNIKNDKKVDLNENIDKLETDKKRTDILNKENIKNNLKVKKSVDEIISSIKKIDGNINIEESNNNIINTIQKIEINKLNKYKLMVKLYEDLIKKNINKANLFTKYIKENVLNEYIIVLNDNKTRRIFNKCRKIYLINNVIKIDVLYKLRIVNDILSLNKDEFNNLMEKLK